MHISKVDDCMRMFLSVASMTTEISVKNIKKHCKVLLGSYDNKNLTFVSSHTEIIKVYKAKYDGNKITKL